MDGIASAVDTDGRLAGGRARDSDSSASNCPQAAAFTKETGIAVEPISAGSGVVMKRIVAFWPYVLIVISLVGLAYTFLAASR